MKIVLDASVVIDYLRTKRQDNLFFRLRPTHDFVVSLVTVAELYSGKSVHENESMQTRLEDIITGSEIVMPTIETAKAAGKLRARYQLSLGDAFVAALALEMKLALLTLDTKDFKQVKDITLYG